MSGDKKYYVFAAVAVVVIAIIFFFFSGAGAPGGYSQRQEQSRLAPYVNPDFHISLEYPEFWRPDISTSAPKFNGNYLRFGADRSVNPGDDGFFGIDAVDPEKDIPIDLAAKTVVLDPAKPYGASPTITSSTVAGMEARLINPSADQQLPTKNGVALIVKYPAPIALAGHTFYFFMLYGDKNHLQSIANTLQFINALQ